MLIRASSPSAGGDFDGKNVFRRWSGTIIDLATPIWAIAILVELRRQMRKPASQPGSHYINSAELKLPL
jgi:hypothetical protein